jgi:hypothetical protein
MHIQMKINIASINHSHHLSLTMLRDCASRHASSTMANHASSSSSVPLPLPADDDDEEEEEEEDEEAADECRMRTQTPNSKRREPIVKA